MEFKGYFHDPFKEWDLKDPKKWFPLFYKEGEIITAIRSLKFKIQLQRSSGPIFWERVIYVKKENPVLFFLGKGKSSYP